jgi:hypothetical protein
MTAICISTVSTVSNLNELPGRRAPVYSSSTETKAHECLFQPRSAFESIWNNNRTLQNQMLSIRSAKAPCEIPGGRMKTKSWRFAPLNCFWTSGPWFVFAPCSPTHNLWPFPGPRNSSSNSGRSEQHHLVYELCCGLFLLPWNNFLVNFWTEKQFGNDPKIWKTK